MKYFRIAFFLILLVLVVANSVPVYAEVSDPDSMKFKSVRAWQSVLEDDDLLVVAHYNIVYSGNSTPTQDVSETFTFRFMDTDNSAELGVVEAYPYNNRGYGQGVVSWYFEASDNISWAQNYWIEIKGKQTVFSNPPSYSYQIPLSAYSLESDVADDIGDTVLTLAHKLSSAWGVVLYMNVETGEVLNETGETYFRQAIVALQAMAPQIFAMDIGDPNYTWRNWSTNQAAIYENRFAGTPIGNSIQGIADLFTLDFNVAASIPLLIAAVPLLIVAAVQGNVLSGFLGAVALMLLGTLLGWFPMAMMSILTFLSAAFSGYHLFLKSSQ